MLLSIGSAPKRNIERMLVLEIQFRIILANSASFNTHLNSLRRIHVQEVDYS